MNCRIMYIRDANWTPIGCVVIKVDRSHRRASYNLAMLNPKDKIKFDRHESQRLALLRLIENPISVSIPKDATQHDISLAVMCYISDSHAPTRAVKFAKAWVDAALLWYDDVFDRPETTNHLNP
jgi:hypothetical protein